MGGHPPYIPIEPDFDNLMNNLWYITGDEGCGEVSSELCVCFLRRKQIPILGGNPRGPPSGPIILFYFIFFNAMNKLWYIHGDEWCGKGS